MRTTVEWVTGLFLAMALLAGCEDSREQQTGESVTHSREASKQQAQSDEGVKQSKSRLDWEQLLLGHTSGYVSKDSKVTVEFKRAVVEADEVGGSANRNISIRPNIKGQAVYESTSKIVFTPEKPLKSGQKYQVTVHPAGLKGAIATSNSWSFGFSTVPLEYEIRIDSLESVAGAPELMTLNGQLQFSDRVDAANAARVLGASLQDQALPIEWESTPDGREHRFLVSNIKRESFAADMLVFWDGTPVGIKTTENEKAKNRRRITIPSLNEFKVLGARLRRPRSIPAYSETTPFIQISLSEEHDKTQNLKGLISLKTIPTVSHPTAKDVPFQIVEEGNLLRVFIKGGITGKLNVAVNENLKGVRGNRLGKTFNRTINVESLKPAVRFVGGGNILPDNDKLEIPFEAANVDTVQISAMLIYPENMGQFLQTNRLAGDYQLGRVGRHLWRRTITLNPNNPAQWNRYTLDASKLLESQPGGMFRLELSIDRRFSTYECADGNTATKATDLPIRNHEDDGVQEKSHWDALDSEYSQSTANWNWKWEERNNPCSDAYFQYHSNPVQVAKNFIASNIGLMAKRDEQGNMVIVTTDLRTSEPMSGVQLEIRNYQHQKLDTALSNSQGIARVNIDKTPFLLIARKGKEVAYLKLNGNTALAVSHFDVGGQKVTKGLKGVIYGERGVWRPGDDIYLTFVLQDKDNTIPENHPVKMDLIDPRGRVVDTIVNTQPVGDFYRFQFKTDDKAETGKWLVKARLGGNEFSRTLAIETVRPNRLKIELDFGTDTLHGYQELPEGKLFSQWLHGADADGLKADVSVRFREKTTRFDAFGNYVFDDPARRFDSSEEKILEGRLDEQGKLVFSRQFKPKGNPPGMLSAWFTTRVFEKGGAFSTSKQFMDYYPYANYVGLKLPSGDAARNMLLTDQKHTVNIASLNAEGEAVDLDRVQITLYKINWRWWWDKSPESLARFSDANHNRKLQQSIVKTTNGIGSWEFQIDYPDWGRYLVRACDMAGKHCTGKTLYVDWPDWAGRAQEQSSGAANRLELFTDKKEYQPGDTAVLQLPATTRGRAFVSVENGSSLLSQQWIEFDEARQQVEIPVTAAMAPNAYVNVTLLQPHQNKANDRPIRLFGIIPLLVKDPASRLYPVLAAADEWKPQSTHSVTISEKDGKPMEYTLAMVDEGLLGLTRFETPDLHQRFYRKEALGVKSWDLFDDVVGAYGGSLERLLALGGGDEVQLDDAANKPKRFPPVVQVLGPFHLDKDEQRIHDLQLPAYLGAVRLMVVAGQSGAYGKAEKSVYVRQPLMMQPALPRVLSVNEEVAIPVTLFVTDDSIRDVTVSLESNELLDIVGDDNIRVSFDKSGDQLGFLRIKTGPQPGPARLKFTAVSGEHQVESEVHIDVRRPNSQTSRYANHVIQPDDNWSEMLTPFGLPGSNSAVLEVSSLPPLGIEKHLNELVRYPHGCLEQTISSAFPQLYLTRLMDVGPKRSESSEKHVRSAIERIRGMQDARGSFNYWPAGNHYNEWSDLYAGHFLVEAQRIGYQIPAGVLQDWLTVQSGLARNWLAGNADFAYMQAYRLYVLALAGKPELGSMNRMRESAKLNAKARWLLAAAYHKSGQIDAAGQVVQGLVADPNAVTAIKGHTATFSSRLSELGQVLETLVALNRTQDAEHYVKAIADELAATRHNTHGLAWALMSVAKSVTDDDGNAVSLAYALGGGALQTASSQKAYLRQELGALDGETVLKLKSASDKPLYTSVIRNGVPDVGAEESLDNGLALQVGYRNTDNAPLDLSQPVRQGSDVVMAVSIRNTSGRDLDNIALSQLLPSGWEIHNARYQGQGSQNSKLDHQDVRDDRVYRYFSLKKGESKHFTLLANAAFKGRYYLPAVTAEAMYEPSIEGRQQGQWVEVVGDGQLLSVAHEDPGR